MNMLSLEYIESLAGFVSILDALKLVYKTGTLGSSLGP